MPPKCAAIGWLRLRMRRSLNSFAKPCPTTWTWHGPGKRSCRRGRRRICPRRCVGRVSPPVLTGRGRDTGATLASGDAPALSGSGSGGEVDSFSAQLGINWEVDVLLRLRDDERRAALEFLAREVSYEWTELGIAASVASAYFSHAEAWQLLRLYGRRLENLAANLDIVESGYRQGINEALDVYLARSVLEQQRSQVAQQASLVTESALQLQRLLGRIPDGGLPPGRRPRGGR